MNVLIGCPNFRQINVILNERLKGYNFCHISGHGLKTTYEEMFLSLSSSHQFNVEIVWNCAKSSILSTQIDFLLTFFSLSRWKSFICFQAQVLWPSRRCTNHSGLKGDNPNDRLLCDIWVKLQLCSPSCGIYGAWCAVELQQVRWCPPRRWL